MNTPLSKKQLQLYKKTLRLDSEQREIIVGTLLGDSGIALRKGKPTNMLKFEQGEKHKDYVYHLYDKFKAFCGKPPSERIVSKDDGRKSYWFRTYSHQTLQFYFNYFYRIQPAVIGQPIRAKKIVPKTIHKFLTARALAYWFMDDGTYNTNKSLLKYYLFSTQGFEKFEVDRLAEAITINFGIKTSVHKDKNKWRIYILAESSELFLNLITPYLHQDFLYKI